MISIELVNMIKISQLKSIESGLPFLDPKSIKTEFFTPSIFQKKLKIR
jgi:hypothetical protein